MPAPFPTVGPFRGATRLPRSLVTLLLTTLVALARPASADEIARCGSPAGAHAIGGSALDPADTLVRARLVFVSFPDSPDSTMPVWADSMASELTDYYAEMSGGRARLEVAVVRRADAPTRAWRAPRPAAEYAGPAGLGWARANRDVLAFIAAAQPGAWSGIEHVWVLHDQCVFGCTDASTPDACEDTCPWAGIASLGLPSGIVPGLQGDGTTQRFLVRLPSARQHRVQLSVAVHEFGHRLLGTGHSPGSDDPAPGWINYGRYDVMRSGVNGGLAREAGLVPYHPLTLAAWGWRPLVRLASDSLGVHVPDLWSARGAVIEVVPRASTQSFVLAHHGARSRYALDDGGTGLHVWHVRRDISGRTMIAWDLESAAGRRSGPAPPDAITGLDPLEADPFALGSGEDFFRAGGPDAFSALTNPASGLYASDARLAPESLESGVAIENLRTDGASGDLVVDVWVTPAQAIEPPPPGPHALGDTIALRWRPRPSADVATVRVELLREDGHARTLGEDLANSGAFAWVADEAGASLRWRLTSRDARGAEGVRTSAAFGVAAVAPRPEVVRLAAPRPQPARDEVALPFALPIASRARIEILDAAGRRVRTLLDAEVAAGEASVRWNGTDANGRRVPAGIYLARLHAGGRVVERRVVWLP